MPTPIEIGQYIQRLRKEKGYSQKQLAEHLSISFQAVSKWETGESLPDIGLLLDLASLLDTTTDKLLSAGHLVIRKNKFITVEKIKEGFKALEHLKEAFGEKSSFYQGVIQGINQKMNIDFEAYMHQPIYRETMLAEVIIQYLMQGYHIDKEDINQAIQSEKMKNLISKYQGEDTPKTHTYCDHPQLFDQLRAIKKEFETIDILHELPGEYIRMEPGKIYLGTQVETNEPFCYGIAIDDAFIYVFTYLESGENQTLIHQEKRLD